MAVKTPSLLRAAAALAVTWVRETSRPGAHEGVALGRAIGAGVRELLPDAPTPPQRPAPRVRVVPNELPAPKRAARAKTPRAKRATSTTTGTVDGRPVVVRVEEPRRSKPPR